MQNINIAIQGESPFYYGMKVYVICANPHNRSKTFTDRCPVCGDARRVEIKGYDLPCPMCNSSSRARSDAVLIHMTNFAVVEFIINEVSIKGSTYKSDYKITSDKLPYAEWHGFARWGNGYRDMETRKFGSYDFREVDVEKVDLQSGAMGVCFCSKAEANRFCKRLHERQAELLDKFNAEHGSDHQYPFEF